MWPVACRLNFTLRHLDVTCEAYDHFRASLEALERPAGGPLRFMVEPVEASFPQRLLYERIQQLVGPSPGGAAGVPTHSRACRRGTVLARRRTRPLSTFVDLTFFS